MESLRRTCAFWLDYLRVYTDGGISQDAPLSAMVLAARDAGLSPIRDLLDDIHARDALIPFQSEVDRADRLRHLLQTHLDSFERQITHIARDRDH